MGNKVRVRARQTRGSGVDAARDGLQFILVENYDDTKANYDKLSQEHQEKFDEIMGAEMASAFKQSKMMVELNMNILEDHEELYENMNQILGEVPEEAE